MRPAAVPTIAGQPSGGPPLRDGLTDGRPRLAAARAARDMLRSGGGGLDHILEDEDELARRRLVTIDR